MRQYLLFWYPINISQKQYPFRNVSTKGALCRWAQIKSEHWPISNAILCPNTRDGFYVQLLYSSTAIQLGALIISKLSLGPLLFYWSRILSCQIWLIILSCSEHHFRMVFKSLCGKILLRKRDTVYYSTSQW